MVVVPTDKQGTGDAQPMAPVVVREQPLNKNAPRLNALQLKKRIDQRYREWKGETSGGWRSIFRKRR